MYQELPLPITSCPPGCPAQGLCFLYELALYSGKAHPVPTATFGSQGVSGPPLGGDTDTHPGLQASATLQGIFQTAVILIHYEVEGQANFCSVKNLALLRSH